MWLRRGNHGGLLANQRETLGGAQATSGPPAGTPQVLFLAGKAVAQQNDSQTCTDEATAGFAAEILWIAVVFFSSQIQPAIKEESFSLKEFHLNAFSVVIIHFLRVKGCSELHCLTRTEMFTEFTEMGIERSLIGKKKETVQNICLSKECWRG